MDWIDLAEERDICYGTVNTAIYLLVPQNKVKFLFSKYCKESAPWLVSYLDGLCPKCGLTIEDVIQLLVSTVSDRHAASIFRTEH